MQISSIQRACVLFSVFFSRRKGKREEGGKERAILFFVCGGVVVVLCLFAARKQNARAIKRQGNVYSETVCCCFPRLVG